MKKLTLILIVFILGIKLFSHPIYQKNFNNEKGYIKQAPKRYHALLRTIQFKFNIPEELLFAVPMTESSWNDDAISSVGCLSLMQLNPKFEDWFEEEFWPYIKVEFDIHNPKHSLFVGFAYLRHLKDRFGTWDLALQSYNVGPTRFARILETNDILPIETQDYLVKINKVISDRNS